MNVSKPTLLLTEAIRARCRENLAAVRWRMAEACRLTGRAVAKREVLAIGDGPETDIRHPNMGRPENPGAGHKSEFRMALI